MSGFRGCTGLVKSQPHSARGGFLSENESESRRPALRNNKEGLEFPDERQLVQALRKGDAKAFEELVRSHGPRLLAVARRIVGEAEEARDCVQETFMIAHRRIHDFQERSRLATWLHRIVTNAALMKLRTRRRHPEESHDPASPTFDRHGIREGSLHASDLSPESLLLRADTRKFVREAIDQLPETYRVVLLLRDIEGYSTEETADLIKTNKGVVKVRLHRARNALKERLAPLLKEDLR